MRSAQVLASKVRNLAPRLPCNGSTDATIRRMLGSHLSMRVLILKHTAASKHNSQLHTNRKRNKHNTLPNLLPTYSPRLVRHGRPRRLRRSHDIVPRRCS